MNKDRLPKVSVVIPLFNQAQYLPEAVESVLDQTYHDFEIIVVDDGSTDESFAAARQYGEKTRYIRQEKTGLGGARNTGIKASQGELIGLLNADDRWLPTYLETMVRLADENPEAAVYYCCAQAMDEHSNDLPQIFGGKSLPVKLMYESLLRANILIPSTVLVRKAIVSAAGLFDQTLRDIDSCEDWDLWLRIAPKHDFVGVPMRLTRYRLYGNTVSSPLTGVQTAVRAVIEKHFGPDDGQWHMWSDEKRRAYGGVYRFYLLNLVKRQYNWRSAAG